MKLKTYTSIRLVITFSLAMIIGQAVIVRSFIIPIMSIIVAALILFTVRRQVKEVIADERDYAMGGRSALLSIQIYSWVGVILMFVMYSKQKMNPIYGTIASTLSYSVLFLLFLNSLVYHFYIKKKSFKK